MKIAFWSNIHGQSGSTSNLIAIALMTALEHELRTAVTQCHFNLNNLEKPLIGAAVNNISEIYLDTGIDALARNLNEPFTEEIIENCSISLLGNRLSLYPGTAKSNQSMYENAMVDKIHYILNAIEKCNDITFIDTPQGNSKLSRAVLDTADMIVVNLNQNRNVIEDYIEKYHFPEEKLFYLIGNYNYNSRYNARNIVNSYKGFKHSNMAVIPYNVDYLDSLSDSQVIAYLRKTMNCERQNKNYYFIRQVRNATNKILKKAGF